ncbi:MAG: hypothetical protein V1866_02300 [archaeon]
MNTLSKEEAMLFHKLMDSLLLYVNQKTGIIKNINTMNKLHQNNIEKTMLLRKKIFSEKYNFVDTFVKENPFNFLQDELDIISSWKKWISGKFFMIKHVSDFSLFFDSESKKVYGVKGITDSFEEKFQGYAPILLDITLLPFKDHIIYDGLFAPYNISFGSGMRKSLKAESEEAILEFGIITSLSQPAIEKQQNDEKMLRFYMKSFDNKMRYELEINKLKKKSKELESVYYREEGRDFAKSFKKSLKELDVKGCFAVLNNVIAASGADEKELGKTIEKIVPKDKRDWIYTFKIS